MAHLLASSCSTSIPGTRRKSSGMLSSPERWMSSWLMTVTAEGASAIFSSCLETLVTSTFIRSSRLSDVRSSPQLAEWTGGTDKTVGLVSGWVVAVEDRVVAWFAVATVVPRHMTADAISGQHAIWGVRHARCTDRNV